MLLSDNESSLLKKWVIRKLESISDADSDVLADYVLALVNTEESEPIAKAACVANLKDFVPDEAERFVDELFKAVADKSYDPNRPALKPTAPTFQSLKDVAAVPLAPLAQSKKRSYWESVEQPNGEKKLQEYGNGNRPIKHARRGGRGRGHHGGRHEQHLPPYSRSQLPQSPSQPRSQFPILPPEIPPFDPANPLPAFMAMAQALETFYSNQNGGPPATQRCRNMELTGACADGLSCPYDHSIGGWDQSQDDAYDPTNAVFPGIKPSRIGQLDAGRPQRGRGRGRRAERGSEQRRRGGQRSEFAHLGFNHDSSVTTIVVESIPYENCNEQDIRNFFSDFGAIEEVILQPAEHLALVKFSDRAAAESAWHSPKVIFDNRFVKVFMGKSEQRDPENGETVTAGAEEDMETNEDNTFDMEAFVKRQHEAQRKHEDVMRQREEATRQRDQVTARLVEMEMQRRKLEALLIKKAATSGSPLENGSIEESEDTKALQEQLAQLKEEAQNLGIDPDAASVIGFSNDHSNGHGYSSFRGRTGFRGRGRGRGRARYRGSAWFGAGGRGGAVMRLDNRPKTVAMTFSNGTYQDHAEAVRQFLLFNSLDTATLADHPGSEDSALISFQHRFEGEIFMAAAPRSELPHIGKVKMSWYKGTDKAVVPNGNHRPAEDNVMINGSSEPPSSVAAEADAIFEGAEEDLDRWG